MTGPTRSTEAGRAYLDLQNTARADKRPTDELHQLYALECFLDRLVRSRLADRFVLKGGVLLGAYAMRRPTRDVDLRADALPTDPDIVLDAVRTIAAVPVDDGITFDTANARAEAIREDDVYQGVRVTMTAHLATARLVFHVDVSVGDPVVPHPGIVELPRLRGGALRVVGYPLAMVHAEKIVTALERGQANTRWRDFADIRLLSARHDIDGTQLCIAIAAVAAHRGVPLEPLAAHLDGYADLAQNRWAAWIRKQRLDDRLPRSFTELLDAVLTFADPALTGTARSRTWNAHHQQWT